MGGGLPGMQIKGKNKTCVTLTKLEKQLGIRPLAERVAAGATR